jgi:hypothetical protein
MIHLHRESGIIHHDLADLALEFVRVRFSFPYAIGDRVAFGFEIVAGSCNTDEQSNFKIQARELICKNMRSVQPPASCVFPGLESYWRFAMWRSR